MASSKGLQRVVLSLWLSGASAACAHQGAHGHAAHASIIVTGTGEARGAPDVVRTSIGVEARAQSAEDALAEANARIAQVLSSLKAMGIADSDLRTHGFSVSYDREYSAPAPASVASPELATPAPAVTARGKKQESADAPSTPAAAPAPSVTRGSYAVNNQLEVTLRDVSKLGALLASATASGANNVWGVNFDLADKRPLIEKARAQAIENALADAKRVAALSGVKLGKIVRVSDGVQAGGAIPLGAMREQALASNVPVQQGELTISHQVSIELRIED